MSGEVKPIPEGYHSVTPHLIIKGAREAIEFYKKAFGAEVVYTMDGPGGSVMHGEITIGDSHVFVADEMPQMPGNGKSPSSLGGFTQSLMIYTEDTDAAYKRAVEAGGEETAAPEDMFWGDRYAKVTDPFGHQWQLATRIENPTPEQIRERVAKMFGGGQ